MVWRHAPEIVRWAEGGGAAGMELWLITAGVLAATIAGLWPFRARLTRARQARRIKGMKNPAVGAYIAKSAEFARPILAHIRRLMHKACPQIVETIKWGVPHFEHKGIVAMMAAFTRHAAFGFWSRKLLTEKLGKDAPRLFPKGAERGMGGRKVRTLADLPPDAVIVRAAKMAVALNERGERPKRESTKKPPVKPPPYFVAALNRNPKAKKWFEAFTPAQRREYVDWLVDAKQDATRERRLATAIQWLSEGRQRHWKYQNC